MNFWYGFIVGAIVECMVGVLTIALVSVNKNKEISCENSSSK